MKMSENYFEESIDVADNFIKTICFVDDQPFFNDAEDPINGGIDHRINADIITKVFAKKGKSCSFFKYNKIEDEDTVLKLAQNCDVTVLDWKIIMEPTEQKGKEVNKVLSEEELEEDVDIDESRGIYAIKLIEKILGENHKTPKLIIVFTAEYDTEKIVIPIRRKLDELGINYEENEDELYFHNDKIRLSIYFKLPEDRKHISEEVKRKEVNLERLPEIINSEFAQLTNALVLQAAIRAISEVRNNTYNLLESYNRKLDPAYLTHRSLLPNPDDAEDQLLEIIGSDIKSLIKESEINSIIKTRALPLFLKDQYRAATYPFMVDNREQLVNLNPPENINIETLQSIVLNGVEKTFYKKEIPFEENVLFSKICHKSLTNTFANNADEAKMSDIKFSILTTIKPRYLISDFTMTLGTILKEDRKESYWLCVQPKCDSVRITQKKRSFLLLKLNVVESQKKFHFVLKVADEFKFFKINYKIYDSQLVDFITHENGNVRSFESDSQIKFKRGDNKDMLWIGELKNDFAQNVSNSLAFELSRVGLDLSEWLRRWSGN